MNHKLWAAALLWTAALSTMHAQTTGPAVGRQVPAFELTDQHNTTRSLADLTGPEGLLLVFSRSADW